MNNWIRLNFETQWQKSLCFFLFIVVSQTAITQIENSYFTYDTTWIVPVETSMFHLNCDLPMEVAVDGNRRVAYIFLDVQHDERKIHFLEISTKDGTSKIHEIRYDKKTRVDSRTRQGSIAILPKSGGKQILIRLDNLFLIISTLEDKIIDVKKRDNDYNYVFPFNGYSIVANYYNGLSAKHNTGIALVKNDQMTSVIHPPSDFIQFTHFNPNRLVDCSEENILWLSVSKPMLFLYDHNLLIEDSICFDSNTWVDVNTVKDLPKYRQLREKGIFEFGSSILEDTASKNLSVQFVNDTLILVTSNYTTSVIRETLFSVTSGNHLKMISSRTANIDSLFSRGKQRENYEVFNQSASGNIQENRLYYSIAGSGTLPWNKSSVEIDNQKYTYIHLHVFNFNRE